MSVYRLLLNAVRHYRANNASQRYAASDDGFLNAWRHLVAKHASNDQDDAAPGGRLFQPINEIVHSFPVFTIKILLSLPCGDWLVQAWLCHLIYSSEGTHQLRLSHHRH